MAVACSCDRNEHSENIDMRRYEASSRGRAWNGARARRDADLFFADLMGTRPRMRGAREDLAGHEGQPEYEDPSVYESAPAYEDPSVYESASTYEGDEADEGDEHEGVPEIGDAYEDVHGPELAQDSEVEWEADASELADDDEAECGDVEDDPGESADGFAYDVADEDSPADDDESADAWEEP
jgi:hypothetical protein